MRTQKVYKKVSIEEPLYNRLIKDRNEFQKIVGGGRWSISDTITEYLKIINAFTNGKNIKTKAIK